MPIAKAACQQSCRQGCRQSWHEGRRLRQEGKSRAWLGCWAPRPLRFFGASESSLSMSSSSSSSSSSDASCALSDSLVRC